MAYDGVGLYWATAVSSTRERGQGLRKTSKILVVADMIPFNLLLDLSWGRIMVHLMSWLKPVSKIRIQARGSR